MMQSLFEQRMQDKEMEIDTLREAMEQKIQALATDFQKQACNGNVTGSGDKSGQSVCAEKMLAQLHTADQRGSTEGMAQVRTAEEEMCAEKIEAQVETSGEKTTAKSTIDEVRALQKRDLSEKKTIYSASLQVDPLGGSRVDVHLDGSDIDVVINQAGAPKSDKVAVIRTMEDLTAEQHVKDEQVPLVLSFPSKHDRIVLPTRSLRILSLCGYTTAFVIESPRLFGARRVPHAPREASEKKARANVAEVFSFQGMFGTLVRRKLSILWRARDSNFSRKSFSFEYKPDRNYGILGVVLTGRRSKKRTQSLLKSNIVWRTACIT